MSSATMTNWCLCSKRFDGDRTEEHPRSAAAPFGPQMARQHQRRHPQPVRADVENLMEREMHRAPPTVDRKGVVKGKRVSVRVDLGGRRIIKTKKNTKN